MVLFRRMEGRKEANKLLKSFSFCCQIISIFLPFLVILNPMSCRKLKKNYKFHKVAVLLIKDNLTFSCFGESAHSISFDLNWVKYG